jgi:hypothetical protein
MVVREVIMAQGQVVRLISLQPILLGQALFAPMEAILQIAMGAAVVAVELPSRFQAVILSQALSKRMVALAGTKAGKLEQCI